MCWAVKSITIIFEIDVKFRGEGRALVTIGAVRAFYKYIYNIYLTIHDPY